MLLRELGKAGRVPWNDWDSNLFDFVQLKVREDWRGFRTTIFFQRHHPDEERHHYWLHYWNPSPSYIEAPEVSYAEQRRRSLALKHEFGGRLVEISVDLKTLQAVASCIAGDRAKVAEALDHPKALNPQPPSQPKPTAPKARQKQQQKPKKKGRH